MSIIAATFASSIEAERAKSGLIDAGVAAERIVLSIALTDDGIGAEAPGQSYENQGYGGSDEVDVAPGRTDTDRARYASDVRSGGCVLSVRVDSAGEEARIAALLRQGGARSLRSAR